LIDPGIKNVFKSRCSHPSNLIEDNLSLMVNQPLAKRHIISLLVVLSA